VRDVPLRGGIRWYRVGAPTTCERIPAREIPTASGTADRSSRSTIPLPALPSGMRRCLDGDNGVVGGGGRSQTEFGNEEAEILSRRGGGSFPAAGKESEEMEVMRLRFYRNRMKRGNTGKPKRLICPKMMRHLGQIRKTTQVAMSAENEVRQLISEVFSYKRIPDGTCFYVNEPGVRLIKGDASYLPLIKSTLRETAQNSASREALKHVVGAFLVISSRYEPDSIVSFIRSLPSEIQGTIIMNSPLFFRKVRAGDYNFGVAPAPQLIEFIEEMAKAGESTLQEKSRGALRELFRPAKGQA